MLLPGGIFLSLLRLLLIFGHYGATLACFIAADAVLLDQTMQSVQIVKDMNATASVEMRRLEQPEIV